MPCRTQHSQSQGGPRGSLPAPGSGGDEQMFRWVTGRGLLQGCPWPPHSLSGTDWHLHLYHSHTQARAHHCLTRAWSRPIHTCGGICMLSHPHNQTRTCVYMHTTAHCHTPSGTCHHCEHHPRGTDLHVQPQKGSCSDTRVGSPGSLLTVTDGRWQPRHLFPAHPSHLPLTRSLGGWASTAKVDRCWHWQRVCAAWVSSVWQLSVSQSPELASLGWAER